MGFFFCEERPHTCSNVKIDTDRRVESVFCRKNDAAQTVEKRIFDRAAEEFRETEHMPHLFVT